MQAEIAFDEFLVEVVSGGPSIRQRVAIILGIHLDGEIDLFQIVQASRPPGSCLGTGQDWQQQCRQNGDDGDDHEQFNQRKCAF